MPTKTYVCLDVGETITKLVKVTLIGEKLYISGTYQTPTKGVADSDIYSKIEFQSCITDLLNKAKRDVMEDINELILVLPSSLTKTYRQRTEIRCIDPRQVSTENDVLAIKEKFNRDFYHNKDREVVFRIYPINYYRDDIPLGLESPIGYKCQKIGMEAFIHTIPKSTIASFNEALKDMGINVVDTLLSPMANGAVLLSPKEYTGNSAIIDIGGKHTTFSFFHNKIMIHQICIGLGTKYIVEQLAKEFEITLEEANKLFEKYACAIASTTEEDIIVYKTDDGKGLTEAIINKNIETSINHILSSIYREGEDALNALKNSTILVTGGGAFIKKLDYKINDFLKKHTIIRSYNKIGGTNHIYTTAIGGVIAYLFLKKIISESIIQY